MKMEVKTQGRQRRRSRLPCFIIISICFVLRLGSGGNTAEIQEKHVKNLIPPTPTRAVPNADQELKGAEPSTTSRPKTTFSTYLPATVLPGNQTPATDSPDSTDCVKPAIKQFFKPWMSQSTRVYGGFIFYTVVTAYTFLALAVICDEFFVPSLDILCDVLKISPDVAGATFMAAGSSAPELATSLIGVFVVKDDIGVSGVIGSAVFNIMFVISLCGLLTPKVLYLNWWPMVRDCFFYMVSILALLWTIADESIEWYESVVLLLLYVLYCYVMYVNEILEAWAHTLPVPLPVHANPAEPDQQPQGEKSHLVTYKAVSTEESAVSSRAGAESGENTTWGRNESQETEGGETGRHTSTVSEGANKTAGPAKETILVKFNPPVEGGWRVYLWRANLPLVYIFYYTVPDCRMETWKTWYLFTFFMSMVWISVFSYIMVWMITVLGFTAGIPDTVMGLTFIAAGVSVPDALSSLAVVKEGYADMAVSNAVGSNVFDILVCLGLPWFLYTAIYSPGSSVRVTSKGLVYSTLSLLSTVAFLLIATHYNGWKLDKKYGIMLLIWYAFFMIFASLYELNVFGDFNPKVCDCDW